MDFQDLFFERGYRLMKAYARSKLGNVMYTASSPEKLAGTGVTVNCLHPGAVDTAIWSGPRHGRKPLISIIGKFAFISAEERRAPHRAPVASPELSGITGQYFEKDRWSTRRRSRGTTRSPGGCGRRASGSRDTTSLPSREQAPDRQGQRRHAGGARGQALLDWGGREPAHARLPRPGVGRAAPWRSELFAKLVLDGFQAGCRGPSSLNKRRGSSRSSTGSIPERMARYDRRKIAQVLKDPGIVRNRQKFRPR